MQGAGRVLAEPVAPGEENTPVATPVAGVCDPGFRKQAGLTEASYNV